MSKVQLNHSTKFNPYEHLTQSVKEDGLPAYEPYLKDGIVQITPDGNVILVPKVHLDGNAYRDWFHHEYPEGRTEIIRHTASPYLLEDGKFIYPEEVFEVKFYLNKTDEHPKTSGFGQASYKEGSQFDEVPTAITNAFKNGLRNMGFGVDLDYDTILEHLPKYIEPFVTSAKYVLERPLLSEEDDITKKVWTAGDNMPLIAEEVKTPQVKGKPIQKEEEKEVPTQKIEAVTEDSKAALSFIQQQNMQEEKKQEETAEAEQKKESPVNEIEEPIPGIDDINNDVSLEESSMTLEEAMETIVESLPSAPRNFANIHGKKLGDLPATTIDYLGKPDLKWDNKISEKTRNAAIVIKNNKK